MAKSRKKKKKTRPARHRLVSLMLFLAAAGILFWARQDLLWGIKGYLLREIDYCRIRSEADLPPRSGAGACPAEVVGVPDYKNVPRFPNEGVILTCYRMVGFGNRLCVCSEKGLAKPKAITEIIKSRTIRGRLETLQKSVLNTSLRRHFLKAGNIRLAEDAFLLTEDDRPLPSRGKMGLLAGCAFLCCFFAWRLIKP